MYMYAVVRSEHTHVHVYMYSIPARKCSNESNKVWIRVRVFDHGSHGHYRRRAIAGAEWMSVHVDARRAGTSWRFHILVRTRSLTAQNYKTRNLHSNQKQTLLCKCKSNAYMQSSSVSKLGWAGVCWVLWSQLCCRAGVEEHIRGRPAVAGEGDAFTHGFIALSQNIEYCSRLVTSFSTNTNGGSSISPCFVLYVSIRINPRHLEINFICMFSMYMYIFFANI